MPSRVAHARRPRADGAVLASALPGHRVRDVGLAVAFAGTVAAAGKLSVDVPGSPVPVSAQSFAVIAGGMTVGTAPATAGAALYGALATAGVRSFAPRSRATVGYLAGFLLTAPLVGALADRGRTRTVRDVAAGAAAAHAVILAAGAAWLRHDTGMHVRDVWRQGVAPFVPGAMVKTAATAAVVPLVRRASASRIQRRRHA